MADCRPGGFSLNFFDVLVSNNPSLFIVDKTDNSRMNSGVFGRFDDEKGEKELCKIRYKIKDKPTINRGATYHSLARRGEGSCRTEFRQAWDLLMTAQYRPFVAVLCRDSDELSRLRQLVVNSVRATDIMDPDLKKLRNGRWDKAFNHTNVENQDTSHGAINRKATIVIEHIIQASDVSHTMQHWQRWNVYTKWNARLFKEMYGAYIEGRGGAEDPSTFWAKCKIGFFQSLHHPSREEVEGMWSLWSIK